MENDPIPAPRPAIPSEDGAGRGAGASRSDGAGSRSVSGSSEHGIRAWAAERVAGRSWWVRAPLLVVLAWILHHHLRDPGYASIFAGINLAFHEMGHALFLWLGSPILTAAGGTVFEVGVPLAAGAYLLVRQQDPFGACVCLFWTGTALVGAGLYAADARAQALPLVSPFGPVDVDSHDWTVMLLRVGRLSQDQAIGAALRHSGILTMITGIAGGAWVLRVMALTPRGPSGGRRLR